MSPAERLLKAAELLEKRASEAAPDWRIDDDNHLCLVSITTPVTIVGGSRDRYSFTGPDDATTMYIATVHPGVAKAVAELLRGVATGYASADAMLDDAWPADARVRLIAANRPGLDQALALADLLLAGEQC